MRTVNVGDKLSLKVTLVNATRGKYDRVRDTYEMMDNIDVGIVYIATGGRGWSTTNYSVALVDPTKNIRCEVIEILERRVARCKLLVGKSFKTTNFSKRPYMRVGNSIPNPQVKVDLFTDKYWNTFGSQYGVDSYDADAPITFYAAFKHLEKRKK